MKWVQSNVARKVKLEAVLKLECTSAPPGGLAKPSLQAVPLGLGSVGLAIELKNVHVSQV